MAHWFIFAVPGIALAAFITAITLPIYLCIKKILIKTTEAKAAEAKAAAEVKAAEVKAATKIQAWFRGNKPFVLAVVKQNRWSLRHASKALKNNKDIVLAAVKQDGWSLRNASERLTNNE